ncbi:unnamed protein product [Ranitomeya imitator]|uniref:Protein FAM219B n=1 Tax=Ranitomeya imitator TaxID=111125 RepID=A0ABN9M900_9NEOB|nr:unnamed protein product [Ranitomeya imitator]
MEPSSRSDTGARSSSAGDSSQGWIMESKGPAVEKKGPYLMSKGPTIQAKLQRQRDLARAALRKKGMLGGTGKMKAAPKRSVKFNKGYAALSQASDETLVSQDLNRQLLQDGYHLDEIPDDEDLDLIPPKPVRSISCPCCLGESWSCCIQ